MDKVTFVLVAYFLALKTVSISWLSNTEKTIRFEQEN